MSRYFDYGTREDGPLIDGDRTFIGINAKLSPELLPAGMVAYAGNLRMDKGAARTRGGLVTPGSFNGPVSADDIGNVTSWLWSMIYGAGVYSNPDGAPATPLAPEQITILATDTGVWATWDGAYPMPLALPAGERITGPVTFAEAQNTLLMFRGAGVPPLQWSGDFAAPWTYISFADVLNSEGQEIGILPTPSASWALYFANRLFVPVAGANGPGVQPTAGWPSGGLIDQVAVSDILDFTHFDPVMDEFAINSGGNEGLIALMPYTASSLVAFKERSIWLLANVTGDLSGVTLSVITGTLGCAARLSCVQVGADILFLCQNPPGVYRLNQVIEATVQAAPLPVSDPIQPIIARINWAYAGGAAGVLYGDYYFLCVPLDASPVNNAVLALNTVTGAWESIDTTQGGAPMGIRYLVGTIATTGQYSPNLAVTGTGDPAVDGIVIGSGAGASPATCAGGAAYAYVTTGAGPAQLVLDVAALAAAYPGLAALDVALAGFWQGSAGTGTLTLTAYAGGSLTGNAGTWSVAGGVPVWSTATPLQSTATAFPGDEEGALGLGAAGGIVNGIGYTATAESGPPTLLAIPAAAPGIDEWLITGWNGAQRLFGVDHANGGVYLYGEGRVDRLRGRPAAAIPTTLTTRGYALGEPMAVKSLRRIHLAISTWTPSYSVTLNNEAVGVTEDLVSGQTRNPARYLTFGKPAWATSNANGDFGNPGRQDYAVQCPIQLQPGGGPAAVSLEIEQQTLERYLSRMSGRWGQVTVSNSQGVLELRGCGIEGSEAQRGVKQIQ